MLLTEMKKTLIFAGTEPLFPIFRMQGKNCCSKHHTNRRIYEHTLGSHISYKFGYMSVDVIVFSLMIVSKVLLSRFRIFS